MDIYVFTDGSADNKCKKCGGVGVYFADKKLHKYNISELTKLKKPTSQKMELLAIIRAIETVIKIMMEKKEIWNLKIYTDSMYAINVAGKFSEKWIKYGWKRKVGKNLKSIANLTLVKKIYTMILYNKKMHL